MAFDAQSVLFDQAAPRDSLHHRLCRVAGSLGIASRIGSRRRPEPRRLRAVGVLARLGAVNRVMLTPEGNSFEEMRALVRSLFARGCRTFTMSFHSPSVEPGHTPYVRSSAELQSFLRRIEQFCEFFMQDMQGVAISPLMFRQDVSTMAESES